MTRSVVDHLNYAAPYTDRGAEYDPRSPRTGRAVAQSVAEREFAHSLDGIPTQEHQAGGLIDYERMPSTGQRAPTKPRRPDEAEMRAFVEREMSRGRSRNVTTREWEVFKYFWEGLLSYRETARKIDCDRDRVREAVKRLRQKLALDGVRRQTPRGLHTG